MKHSPVIAGQPIISARFFPPSSASHSRPCILRSFTPYLRHPSCPLVDFTSPICFIITVSQGSSPSSSSIVCNLTESVYLTFHLHRYIWPRVLCLYGGKSRKRASSLSHVKSYHWYILRLRAIFSNGAEVAFGMVLANLPRCMTPSCLPKRTYFKSIMIG